VSDWLRDSLEQAKQNFSTLPEWVRESVRNQQQSLGERSAIAQSRPADASRAERVADPAQGDTGNK